MLSHARDRADTRKLLLLAVALCRRIGDRFPNDHCRRAVEAVEKLADHPDVNGRDSAINARADAAMERLQRAYPRFYRSDPDPHRHGAYLAAMSCGGMWHDPDRNIEVTADAAAGATEGPAWDAERLAQSKLWRDIFRHPFRPTAADPSWRTPDVVGLARGIYAEGTFDRLPLLADALMDAGCSDEAILSHCRGDGPHVRGCWVVDLVLGRE
jgi:hypothetical protein